MTTMNYTPAGYEDDSDEDDFYFDGSGFSTSNHNAGGNNFQTAPNSSTYVSHSEQQLPQSNTAFPVKSTSISKEEEFMNGLDLPNQNNASAGKKQDPNDDPGVVWTALLKACSEANVTQVKRLLKEGNSANEDNDKFTPLMAVCSALSCPEDKLVICAQMLLDANASVTAIDRHLMTPLMHAALHGQTALCKLLIDAGSIVNQQDGRGWTALMYACQNGCPRTVNVLLTNAADRVIMSFDGERAADIAVKSDNSYIAKKLESNDALINVKEADISRASHLGDLGYIKYDALDTFISGLGLANCLHIFQDRNITFHEFLRMSDKDLCEIGIIDPVARKKMTDSIADVHSSDWNISNLTEDTLKKMNTFELSTTIAKVSKYTKCMASSLSFVRASITNHPKDLQLDNAKQKKMLYNQCKDASAAVDSLSNEMVILNKKVNEVISNEDLIDADWIASTQPEHKSFVTQKRMGLFMGVSLSALGLYWLSTKSNSISFPKLEWINSEYVTKLFRR